MKDSLKNLKLEQNKTFPYFSDGEFSMHELFEHVLTQTGPAEIAISSFSIAEVAVRTFFRLAEIGIITNMKCLFDLGVKRHKLGLLFFSMNVVSSISLSKNHSKMILISNDQWCVSIISSANFNINDKKEVWIISADQDIFCKCQDKYTEWFESGLKVSIDEFE